MTFILDRLISFIYILIQGAALIALAPSMLVYYKDPIEGYTVAQEVLIRIVVGILLWGILYNLAGLV